MFYKHESSIVDDGAVIGKGTKVWHFCHISSGAIIGENCVIGQNVYISSGAKIGNNVKIQNNVSIYDGVILQDNVFCGPSVVFTNVKNPRSEVDRKNEFLTTTIEYGVTLGANSTIVCGNTIGRYAFVAAGAVVTTKVKEFSVVAGVPARHIGWISKNGYKLVFGSDECDCVDPSGSKYYLNKNRVVEVE